VNGSTLRVSCTKLSRLGKAVAWANAVLNTKKLAALANDDMAAS
jgi:hypothetical protein